MKKNSQKSQFSGFLPLKIILITSFIILMQSGFLYRGHCIGIGTGDFYSYNEIILIGNILMVSVDCTLYINIIHSAQPSNLIGPFVPRDRPEKNDIGQSQHDIGRSAWKP